MRERDPSFWGRRIGLVSLNELSERTSKEVNGNAKFALPAFKRIALNLYPDSLLGRGGFNSLDTCPCQAGLWIGGRRGRGGVP